MKPRHAAALALLVLAASMAGCRGSNKGWYLLQPPLGDDGYANIDAPLAKWHFLGAFDSAAECERTFNQLNAEPADNAIEKTNRKVDACVATVDPRLAK